MIPTSYDWQEVQVFADDRGKLWKPEIPFKVQNEFFVTNLDGRPRGGHAHREAQQAIWCISGHMTAVLESSGKREIVTGINPQYIITIPPKTWVTLTQFSKEPACAYVIWADRPYDESEIVRDPNEFFQWYGRFPSAVQTIAGELVVGDAFGAL